MKFHVVDAKPVPKRPRFTDAELGAMWHALQPMIDQPELATAREKLRYYSALQLALAGVNVIVPPKPEDY